MRLFLLVLCLAVGLNDARWLRQRRSHQPKATSFVGQATNQLSTAIFQGYIDDNKNMAFSPLGYSAILAILAEGAKGETKQQLVSALNLPTDTTLTRKTYKFIMERLRNTNQYQYNQPELKNFFYIYKNYTINDDYKKILEDYYLTEVRSVERYSPHTIHQKHIEKKEEESKLDEISKEPVEPAVISKTEEIIDLVPPKISKEKFISFALEDKPEKADVTTIEFKPAKNIKEKIKQVKTQPLSDGDVGDEEETMVAVEARTHARSLKVLMGKNDITSSMSVNSFGKKTTKATASNSLMIIFNGMYFRGSWQKPFELVEPGVFYKSSTEKKQVPMMKTKGMFKTGSLPGIDSEAIALPYDGGRYSLLILAPRARDGLTRLIADLPSVSLSEIQDSMGEEEMDISVPSFYLETTTKPLAALAKFGVSSIFSPDADLSGVSPAEGLFVQELVQHVAVRVDNGDASTTTLTASDGVSQQTKILPGRIEEKPLRKFSVEHPFLFFIVDRLDNLVVVAGKVIDPQQPTPFEI